MGLGGRPTAKEAAEKTCYGVLARLNAGIPFLASLLTTELSGSFPGASPLSVAAALIAAATATQATEKPAQTAQSNQG